MPHNDLLQLWRGLDRRKDLGGNRAGGGGADVELTVAFPSPLSSVWGVAGPAQEVQKREVTKKLPHPQTGPPRSLT